MENGEREGGREGGVYRGRGGRESNSAANLYVEGLHMEWNSEWEGDRWRGSEREEERMRNGVVNGMGRQDVEGTWSGEMAGGRESAHIPTVQPIFMVREYTWSGIVNGRGKMKCEEGEQ